MNGLVFVVKSGSFFYYVMRIGRSEVRSKKKYKSHYSARKACEKFLDNLGHQRNKAWGKKYFHYSDIY